MQYYEQSMLINLRTYSEMNTFLEKIYWPTLTKEDKEFWVALYVLKKCTFIKNLTTLKQKFDSHMVSLPNSSKQWRNCTKFIWNLSKNKGERIERTSQTLFARNREKGNTTTCFIIWYVYWYNPDTKIYKNITKGKKHTPNQYV